MKTVYLSSHLRLKPDAFEELKAITKKCGFVPINPIENYKGEAKKIMKDRCEAIQSADFFVADLNPFRGYEPGPTVSFEMGYAWAIGKPMYAYMEDIRGVVKKYPAEWVKVENGTTYDQNGFRLGDFGNPANLMLSMSSRTVQGTLKTALVEIYVDILRGTVFQPAVPPAAPKGLFQHPRAYQAGFEVFYANASEVQQGLREIAARYGIEGVPPDSDHPLNEIDTKFPRSMGYTIFIRDQQHVRDTDMTIANLNPFRAVSNPDCGTCFECGMAYGLGKKVYGFIDEDIPLIKRHPAVSTDNGGNALDEEGYIIEDFGFSMELSLATALDALIVGDAEAAAKRAKQDF